MAKISTYPSADNPLLLSDRLIGTEAIRPVPSPTPLATKNFSLGELLQLFSSNFPAASLQAVLNTGNTATQNINLIGTIDVTLIKPDNIEDAAGSQGATFQYLSKGASSINWVDLPVDNLQSVLNSGNTATQDINLTGSIYSTLISPNNIQDEKPSLGNLGQVLTKSATGIVWADNPFATTPGLADVLSVGNTATNDITLIGNITSIKAIPANIQDETASIGALNQVLSKTATGIKWIDNSASTLSLTVTGSSGPSTLIAGVLNIPTYTLSGLGGQPLSINLTSLSGLTYASTSFVKMTATGTFALDTNIYLTGITSSDVTTALGYTPVTNARTLTINGVGYDLTADRSWTIAAGSGTVTSVGLSMPSAFTVSNSPITTAGVITVSGAGTSSQYIRGDGQLATMPSGGGGGSSVNYYLNGSVASSVVGYKQLSNIAIIGGGTDFTRTGNGLITQFLTDVGNPNRIEIPGGAWNFEMWFSISSSEGNTKFYVELLKYDGSIFTTIASTSAVPEAITGGTTIDLYLTSLAVPTTTLLTTDRLAIRVYIVDNSGGRTVTLHTEDNHLCEILTTFSSGVTSLNGLTANTQYLATGTTGTDFNISSITDTHTFNLPSASDTARGLVTTGTQTLAGAKTFSTAPILSSLTASQLLATDASKNIQTLDTATYPSLTELSYSKGVTSAVQTQLNSTVKVIINEFPNTSVTGFTAVEATLAIITIPANTFTSSSLPNIKIRMLKQNDAGTSTIRLKTSTSISGVATATVIGLYQMAIAVDVVTLVRNPVINSGFLRVAAGTSTFLSDESTIGGTETSVAFNPAITNYFFITAENTTALDTTTVTTLRAVKIIN